MEKFFYLRECARARREREEEQLEEGGGGDIRPDRMNENDGGTGKKRTTSSKRS